MNTISLSNGGVQTVTPLQVVYLDFDGANTAYRGELLTIEGITVQNSGLNAAQIAALTDQLNESYGGSVSFVTERPASGDYSTVYVGATDAFTYHGLAETIDEGNQNHSDNAFVNLRGDESLATIQQIISHEVDHLLGTLDHGGDGLAAYAVQYDLGSNNNYMRDRYLTTGDVMNIFNGGVAQNTTVGEGCIYIYKGGSAISTTLSNGYVYVSYGGMANSTIISDGRMLIFSGGTANSTAIYPAGHIVINSGGTANNTTVCIFGSMLISSGGTANGVTLVSGGQMTVGDGATANNVIVNSRSILNICTQSVVSSITVNSGGSMFVQTGGSALNVAWTPCIGAVTVADSAYISYQSNHSGCYFGSANQLQSQSMIMSGKVISGSMYIANGGVADNATVETNGIMTVASGGTANINTVNSGGVIITLGGTANSNMVNLMGSMVISSGGTANNTTISSGYMTVFYGGTVDNTVINYSIYEAVQILSGGTANNTTVNSGYLHLRSGGTANNTTINHGGVFAVSSGGAASNTIVNSGELYISSGGSALNVIWTPCVGKVRTDNGAYVTYQSSYAGCYFGADNQLLSQSMIMSGKTVSTSGLMYVFSGGVANEINTTDGQMYIFSGGVANETNVGNFMYVSNGGVINNTVVNSSGYIYLLSGGIANSTGLKIGGRIDIRTGGIANDNIISSGGTMTINSGGVTNNLMVNSGGTLVIFSGGKITGALTMDTEASVTAGAGAEFNFDVSKRTAQDDYLINDLSLINGVPSYTITVSAIQSAGVYKLAQGAGGLSQTITIGNGASTLGNLSVNGSTVKDGAYEYSLLRDSGNLTLLVVNNDIINPTITEIKASPTDPTNQNVLVSAVFGDDTELASSLYKIGNGDWTTYTGAITVSGNATVYFKAVDTAGNETTAQYEVTNIDKVAPTVSGIKVSVSVPTNQSILVSAVFDDDRALASSQYKIGDGDWTNYTGAITVGSNGTIYFKAVDTAGNETTAQYNVTNIVDLDPKGPAAVTPVAKVNKYDVSVSWKAPAAQDKAKIIGYEVSINGERTVVKGASLSLKAMPVSVGNTVQVRAFDSLGRYGALSDIITFDVKDVTGPTLGKVTTSLDQYTATVSYSGSDNVGVDHYQVKCGDQTQIVAGTSATFDHLALGVNNVAVTAYDAAGNASKAVTAKITVKDVTAPDPVSGLATPTVDSKYKATLSWSAGVDNSGSIASYEIRLDDGKILKSTKTALAVNNLAVGQHSYQVRAIDKAKNVGEWSAAQAFTVLDTTAPGTVSAKAVVAQNSITLSWKAPADNVGVTGYQVWVGASPSTMTMEQMLSADQLSSVLTDIPKGIYYMDVRAIDAAGNMSASKPVKITVSTTLPVNIALSSSSDLLHWKSHDQTSLALASSL